MRTSVLLTTLVCLLGLTSLAHAGPTLASPTIFGSFNQDTAICIIRHIGTAGFISVDVDIFDESGNVVPPDFNSCDVPVAAGNICVVRAPIPSGAAHACSAKVLSGSARNLRGTLTVYDNLSPVFDVAPLRSAELR